MHVLKKRLNPGRPSATQVISWAADWTTTQEEGRTYSLLVYTCQCCMERGRMRFVLSDCISSAGDSSYFRDCSDVFSFIPSASRQVPSSCGRRAQTTPLLNDFAPLQSQMIYNNFWVVCRGHPGLQCV